MTLRFNGLLSVLLLSLYLSGCSPSLTEEELVSRASQAFADGDFAAAELDVKTALQQNPENPVARVLYGQIYLEQINPEAAIGEFSRALEAADTPATRLFLAKSLLLAGRSAEFLSDFENGAYDALQSRGEFQAVVARAYLSQNQYEEARTAFAGATGEGNDYVDITRALFALQLDNDVSGAQETLNAVVERNPRNAYAWSMLGILASRTGDIEAAEESFANASAANPYRLRDRLQRIYAQIRLGQGDEAESDLKRLEKLIPNAPEVNFLRGQLLFNTGDYKNAIDALSQALLVSPNHSGALILSANANAREGNLITASRQYTRFLNQEPGSLDARLQLSEVWRRLGEHQKSEAVAREVLKEHDMNIRALSLLAAALAAQGMHVESAQTYQQIASLQPESVNAQIAAGSQKLAAGDTEAALAQLRAAVALDGTSTAARERLVEAHLALNDIDSAEQAAEAYFDALPDEPRSAIYLARVRLQQEDFENAKVLFESAAERDPGNVEAQTGLAALAVINRDIEGAIKAFETALTSNPGDVATSLNLAALYEQTGDSEAMRGVLEAAIEADPSALEPRVVLARFELIEEQPAAAIELMRTMEETAGHDYRVHQILARAYLATEQPGAAADSLRRLLALRDEDPNVQYLAARVARANGRHEESQGYLEAALTTVPDNIDLRKALIEALTSQGKLQQAIEEIKSLPESAQAEAPMLLLRGRLELAIGNVEAGRDLFARAFELQQNNMNLALLSSAAWTLGERDTVIAKLSSWLEEYPEDALIRKELASKLLETGADEAARAEFERLVEQRPDDVIALNNLAWLTRLDDAERALSYIERADGIAPDSGQIKDTYAMVVLENGDIEKALSLNTKALESMPDNAEIRFNRAQILVRGGRDTEAASILRELVAGPAFPSRQQASELLDSL